MEKAVSNIQQHTLDLIRLMMRMRELEITLLGRYVREAGRVGDDMTDYNPARSAIDFLNNLMCTPPDERPKLRMMSLAEDECPDGFHDDGTGVCVPD